VLRALKLFIDFSNSEGDILVLWMAGTMQSAGIGAEQSLDCRPDEWRRIENLFFEVRLAAMYL
jgi:hypothetical protein